MRMGVLLSEPGTASVDPIGEMIAAVERAAEDGMDSVWMANVFGLDAMTTLAHAGRAVPDIELATGVVPIYTRHPVALAQQALTTQAAVGGRFTLGIGLSHQPVVEGMWGLSFDRPVHTMDEYLSVLLPLLAREPVAFSGDTYKSHTLLATPGTHRVPVLLAALAPRMLRLAAERTDGTVLWMTGPQTIASHVAPVINAAASDAGRPSPRIVCSLPVCVTDDVPRARDRADKVFAVYGQLPSYRAMLEREGAASPGGVAIAGPEDSVLAQIDAITQAGATDFVAAVFGQGDEAERTRALLRSITRTAVRA